MWGHLAGSGGRVWGHVAGVGICHRGQAYGMN